MTYNIEYAYISQEIKKRYEEFGGFANSERLLFLGFKTDDGLKSGIHMRGGLYGQVSKHFLCCGFFKMNFKLSSSYLNQIKKEKKWGYLGLHATGICVSVRKNASKKFIDYILTGNPLFEYRINKELQMKPKEIDYELSKKLPYK